MSRIADDESLALVELPELRRQLYTRMRLRQNTLNLCLLAQTAIIAVYIIFNAINPKATSLVNLLLLPAFIGIIFELMLLDHQIKAMVQSIYMKVSGYSPWQSFYDQHTYEHSKMHWLKSSLGMLDPCALVAPSALGLGMYLVLQGPASILFWLELIVLILIQLLAFLVTLFLTQSRLIRSSSDSAIERLSTLPHTSKTNDL